MNVLALIIAYFQTINLLCGGILIDTSDFANQWETGKLFGPLYSKNPFIETKSIANNGTHTFVSYLVNLPPFGHYKTKWYQVSNEEWEEFAVNLAFEIKKEGEYTCVYPFLGDEVLYNSSDSTEAIQWAIDNAEDYIHGWK